MQQQLVEAEMPEAYRKLEEFLQAAMLTYMQMQMINPTLDLASKGSSSSRECIWMLKLRRFDHSLKVKCTTMPVLG